MTPDPLAGWPSAGGPASSDLLVDWTDPDPARLADRLRAIGLAPSTAGTIELDGGTVRLRRGPGLSRLTLVESRCRVDEPRKPIDAPPGGARGGGVARARLLGVGIATVDAARFLAERPGLDVVEAPDDEILGARAWIAAGGRSRLVVLEPSTEGRLAASLARVGEGPIALYLESTAYAPGARIATGPVGRCRLLPGGDVAGPHLLIVEPSGTITP